MQTAKEYLLQIEKLNAMIANKIAEKQQWKDEALSITPKGNGEKVQTSSNAQKMANAVVNYVDIDREIDSRIIELQNKRREIVETIELLPVTEYDLLHKVYIQGMTLAEAAFAKDKCYSWATTVHGMALKRLQKILDEREREEND